MELKPELIIASTSAAIQLVEAGIRIMNARRQAGEMTPEEEAAWDREVTQRLQASHWTPSTAKPIARS